MGAENPGQQPLPPQRTTTESRVATFKFDNREVRIVGGGRNLYLDLQLLTRRLGVSVVELKDLDGAAVDCVFSETLGSSDGLVSKKLTHFAERKPHFVSEILQ